MKGEEFKTHVNHWRLAAVLCPKNEFLWESLWAENWKRLNYIITSNKTRDNYILYKVKGDSFTPDGLEIVGKAKNPAELHRRYLKGGLF